MTRRLVFLLISIALVLFPLYISPKHFESKASNGYPVRNIDTGAVYMAVQEAIDANETLNGHTILIDPGTFYGSVVVHKSLSIIGNSKHDTTIIGNNTAVVINVAANNVTIEELTVSNGSTGISVHNSRGSLVTNNILVDNINAVKMSHSTNCAISHNIVINSSRRGILVTNSENFTVSYNLVLNVAESWYGINANASSDGRIVKNDVAHTFFDGIGLLNSTGCTIAGNNITDNMTFGIWIEDSFNNSIYHNNIIDSGITVTSSGNFWNSSREGNYWGDYVGVDADHDGIGDEPYTIDGESRDFHPLMGRFNSFDISPGHVVDVISNSTIEDFEYSEANNTIIMHVSNSSEGQTHGFCRVRIDHTLMTPTAISVVIDNGSAPALHANYTLQDDGAYKWIYFAYAHSTRRIDIIPESPSILILTPLAAGCLFTVFTRRHIRHQRLQTDESKLTNEN